MADYTITKQGNWPEEYYNIVPNYYNSVIVGLSALQAENLFRFVNNPISDINKVLNVYNQIDFNYGPAVQYFIDPDNSLTKITSFIDNNTFTWKPSSLRKYNVGPVFNYFSINFGPQDLQTKDDITSKLNYKSYSLYPQKLFLYPIALSSDGTSFYLRTSTVFLNDTTFFFNSSSAEQDAYNRHLAYTTSKPSVTSVRNNSISFNLLYSLSASKNIAINPVIKFTENYNPVTLNILLEPNKTNLRADSIFTKFNNTAFYGDKANNIGQDYPEETPNLKHGFRSSFIHNLNLESPNTTTFQLIQSGINTDLTLEDISNCILSASINLSTTNLKYKSLYYLDANRNPVNILQGVPEKSVQVKYVAESPYHFDATSPVYNNQTTLRSASGLNDFNAFISDGTTPFDNMIWKIPYSPHYYTFKTAFSSANFKGVNDVTNLNFSLSSWTTRSTISSIYLSSCLSSNFNILNLDLPTFAPSDYISLNVIDLSSSNAYLLNHVYCYYGSNLDLQYDLVNSPFVPTTQAPQFLLIYDPSSHGEIDLTFRTSLSSTIFNYRSDCTTANVLKFGQGIVQGNPGYPISLKVLQEEQNKIVLDCSDLVVFPNFPARDLTNSLISWNFTSTSPLSSRVSLQSVDQSGRVVSTISPNSAIRFNSSTWTIAVSGYGPDTTTIILSSQKYNETAKAITNPNLFDYLSEGKFQVGLLSAFNANRITNISLTAAVPIKGTLYNIPQDIPMYWTWSYDGVIYDSQKVSPVTAYDLFNNIYKGSNNFSNNLSGINFSISLSSSLNAFNDHYLSLSAISHYKNNNVLGTLNLTIKDHPDNSIYNTYFNTTYQDRTSLILANANDKNVVTRPQENLNNYAFYGNTNVLPKISASSFKWSIANDLGYYYSLSSTKFSDISSIKHSIQNGARTTRIGLSAYDATIPGWNIAHNIKSHTTIYTIPSSEFFTPTKFIVYPPYTWRQGNSGLITILDGSNFTLAQAPTAYRYTKTSSQPFYLSANKVAISYEYTYGSDQIFLAANSSNNFSASIPYDRNNQEIYSLSGISLSLSAFNGMFPKVNGLTYYGLTSNGSLTGSYTGNFAITSQTIPARNAIYGSTSALSAFYQNPRLVDFQTMTLRASAVDTAIVFDYNTVTQLGVQFTPITAINLEDNLFVGVLQTLTPANSSNSPVRSTQDFNKGVVTYTLSSKEGGWLGHIDVPAVNGLYDLFILNVGDASIPFNVSPYKFNSLVLTASATVPISIPSSTFNGYTTAQYSGSRDLWSTIYQVISSERHSLVAYSTSVKPEIYLSSYYALTGDSIRIEFETPELAKEIENVEIVSYNIYFGDGLSAQHLINDVVYHSYDSKGVYILSYDVNYNNGLTRSFTLQQHPITVFNRWPTYNQSEIRLLSEAQLTLPWTLDQIYIQPNEFGEADIFNTSISRLNDNLTYLKNNIQTINTDAPTLYYGWLGCNTKDLARGIQWHTLDFHNLHYNNTNYATSNGFSYFSNIRDFVETDNEILVLDGKNLRAFSAAKIPTEIIFDNNLQIKQLLVNPVSIDYDGDNNNLYLVDNYKNKVYKFNLSFDYISEINIQLAVGGFGTINDSNKFNAPSEVLYSNDNVFVLDYGNRCVKQYTQDLNWIYTYYTEEFATNIPSNIAIHPTTTLPYVATNNYKIYVFDHMGSVVSNFTLYEARTEGHKIVKILFDQGGDFFYVVTTKNIFKYSIVGTFISIVNIPYGSLNNSNGAILNYTSGKYFSHRSLSFSTNNSIIRCQDIVTLFKVGEGLPYEYWTEDQLLVGRDEFAQDIVYNRTFTRLVQNIKSFRNTMDSRFIIATEQTPYGTVRYFAKSPIAVASRPIFSSDIENETIKVGVNEFNVPQVINRELKKIYEALQYLTGYLSITDVRLLSGINTGCTDPFCWSWKSMSCYNLSLPVVRICNINPITYAELESSYPSTYVYAPSNTWGSATSHCCDQNVSPI